jgi:hypothetical protein
VIAEPFILGADKRIDDMGRELAALMLDLFSAK